MKKLQLVQLLLVTILVGVAVAIIYHYFEAAVHSSTAYVWDTLFQTDTKRWLVIPLCLVLTFIFFAAQHYLDPKAENGEEQGFGLMPAPTLTNLAKILSIGFLSLLAGASLGPEAILVPACMLVGSYIGAKLFKKQPLLIKLLGAAGFMALFAAFFNSFIIGVLSLLLVTKQAKIKPTPNLFILAAVASASTIVTLKFLSSPSYFRLPDYSWGINLATIFTIGLLFIAGYITTYGLEGTHAAFAKIHKLYIAKEVWWIKAVIAALGLSLLYLLGGTLVQFTGNESIAPMLAEASKLGVVGLLWVFIIKVLAISWSKSIGYRGGLVFPTVFLASILVALATLAVKDLNFIYGLIAVMAGIIAANSKTKTLF